MGTTKMQFSFTIHLNGDADVVALVHNQLIAAGYKNLYRKFIRNYRYKRSRISSGWSMPIDREAGRYPRFHLYLRKVKLEPEGIVTCVAEVHVDLFREITAQETYQEELRQEIERLAKVLSRTSQNK